MELCPVLSGWLEGTMPVLPSGVKLRLTEEKKSYGLEELLAESHRIFSLAEQTGEAMILCLTGAAGSGREYAMEQICAGQNLALLLIDGETFRGTERELNACILSAMLYEAYPCVWLGKTERVGAAGKDERELFLLRSHPGGRKMHWLNARKLP